MVVTVQVVAIVEQSRFAHTWIKRMKGDIRQREGPKMQAQLVELIAFRERTGNVWGGEQLFILPDVTQVTISQFCSFSYF